jgi:hypothetical protein
MIIPIKHEDFGPDFMADCEAIAVTSDGELSAKYLYDRVKGGHMQPLAVVAGNGKPGLMLATIEIFDSYRSLTIIGAAGKVEHAVEYEMLWKELGKICQHNGCDRLRIVGVDGFRKKLVKEGWKIKHTVFEKVI